MAHGKLQSDSQANCSALQHSLHDAPAPYRRGRKAPPCCAHSPVFFRASFWFFFIFYKLIYLFKNVCNLIAGAESIPTLPPLACLPQGQDIHQRGLACIHHGAAALKTHRRWAANTPGGGNTQGMCCGDTGQERDIENGIERHATPEHRPRQQQHTCTTGAHQGGHRPGLEAAADALEEQQAAGVGPLAGVARRLRTLASGQKGWGLDFSIIGLILGWMSGTRALFLGACRLRTAGRA